MNKYIKKSLKLKLFYTRKSKAKIAKNYIDIIDNIIFQRRMPIVGLKNLG
jgi:hypothetical protein